MSHKLQALSMNFKARNFRSDAQERAISQTIILFTCCLCPLSERYVSVVLHGIIESAVVVSLPLTN